MIPWMDVTEIDVTTTRTIFNLSRRVPARLDLWIGTAYIVNDQAIQIDAELLVNGNRYPLPVFFSNEGGLAIGGIHGEAFPPGVVVPSATQLQIEAVTATGQIGVRSIIRGVLR